MSSSATVLQNRSRCERIVESRHGVDTDLEKGGLVVIKTMAVAEVADDVCARLEHEAEVLERLGPVSLTPPVTVGREGLNLLVNAIKFTSDGGCISISAHRCEGGVVLRVADSGMGIPAEELPQIFERFYRSSSARKLAVQGTGLGLAITKKIIEEHRGTISVNSRLGEGTEFTVTLPAGPVAPPGGELQVPGLSGEAAVVAGKSS